jgi:hypothetical protein
MPVFSGCKIVITCGKRRATTVDIAAKAARALALSCLASGFYFWNMAPSSASAFDRPSLAMRQEDAAKQTNAA